jgi:hypothetical protein
MVIQAGPSLCSYESAQSGVPQQVQQATAGVV